LGSMNQDSTSQSAREQLHDTFALITTR